MFPQFFERKAFFGKFAVFYDAALSFEDVFEGEQNL